MAKRRDIGSELTPEDFIESRQDDSDSPNPVLDIIRNVDAARDDDGGDNEGMSGGAPSALTAPSSEAEWDHAPTAEKDGDSYFSSRINTKDKFEFQYGIIETRAKVPGGHGIWPAIWMLGDNIGEVGWPASGEIDIMEYVGRMKDTLHTTLHTPATHGDHASTTVTKIDNVEDDFHIYKVEWSKEEIVYYIDGEKVYTFSPEIKDDEHYPFRHKFYFLLNMAIGGNFGGPDVDDSIFPAKFYIDYIKVYQ